MCEYRTGYPIEREDGVIFTNPDNQFPVETASFTLELGEKADRRRYWEGQVREYYSLRQPYLDKEERKKYTTHF